MEGGSGEDEANGREADKTEEEEGGRRHMHRARNKEGNWVEKGKMEGGR